MPARKTDQLRMGWGNRRNPGGDAEMRHASAAISKQFSFQAGIRGRHKPRVGARRCRFLFRRLQGAAMINPRAGLARKWLQFF